MIGKVAALGLLTLGLQAASAQSADAPVWKRLKAPRELGRMMSEEYPAASVRAREQGTVIISACIEARGEMTEVTVQQSSGFQRLDDATVKVFRRLKAAPELDASGAPVRSCNWQAVVTWAIPS
jgi:protein TonB